MNKTSPRAGMLTFEQQGGPFFEPGSGPDDELMEIPTR
jgi:hypothetical protein